MHLMMAIKNFGYLTSVKRTFCDYLIVRVRAEVNTRLQFPEPYISRLRSKRLSESKVLCGVKEEILEQTTEVFEGNG